MGELLCFKKSALEVLEYRIEELQRRVESNEKTILKTSRALFARDSKHDKNYDELRHEFGQLRVAVCKNTQSSEQKIIEFKLEAS